VIILGTSLVVALGSTMSSATTRLLAGSLSESQAASPQQTGLDITSYITLAVAVIALISTFITKKTKSPADELAKADFAYTKIKERLEEVDADRSYLQSVVDALREQLRTFDKDATTDMKEKSNLRDLVEQGEERIRSLLSENRILEARLELIAQKVRDDEPITLEDVYGKVPTMTVEDMDPETEQTQPRQAVNDLI